MSVCVVCDGSYSTQGPPGMCPKCWYANALTDSDRMVARQLKEVEEEVVELKGVVDLSTRLLDKCGLPEGKVRFTRTENKMKLRMVLGDGRKLTAQVDRQQDPSAIGMAMGGLARTWIAEGISQDAAKHLTDMLRVPVIVAQ